jgi:hypothetical protein
MKQRTFTARNKDNNHKERYAMKRSYKGHEEDLMVSAPIKNRFTCILKNLLFIYLRALCALCGEKFKRVLGHEAS